MLAAAGLPVAPDDAAASELVVERDGWRFLLARPRDVGLYVEHGVAEVGIAGKDTLLEHPRQVIEALDLKLGCCRVVLAVPRVTPSAQRPPAGGNARPWTPAVPAVPAAPEVPFDLRSLRRVATKYPRLTEAFLHGCAGQAQVIELHGSVEMAAALGLADAVVDLAQTGRTLRSNGLTEVATLAHSSARLVVNPVAFRVRPSGLSELLERLRAAAGRTAPEASAALRANPAAGGEMR